MQCLGDQQAALVGQQCFFPGDAKVTDGHGCFLLYNTGEVEWLHISSTPHKHNVHSNIAYICTELQPQSVKRCNQYSPLQHCSVKAQPEVLAHQLLDCLNR